VVTEPQGEAAAAIDAVADALLAASVRRRGLPLLRVT
jgi:hypothetical protein